MKRGRIFDPVTRFPADATSEGGAEHPKSADAMSGQGINTATAVEVDLRSGCLLKNPSTALEIRSSSVDRRHSPPLLVKFATGPAQGVIEGYASTFNGPIDAYGDLIRPGAFAASLAEHQAQKTKPGMFWMHNADEPIGAWTDLVEDQHGLKVTGQLAMGTARGREAFDLIKIGALALSIGFGVRDSSTLSGAGGARRSLNKITLFEVSLVSLPANPAARITDAKAAAHEVKSARDFERFLIASGFSKALAKQVTATGWKAGHHASQPDPDVSQLSRDLAAKTAEIRRITKGL
jgi:hypothetical protein